MSRRRSTARRGGGNLRARSRHRGGAGQRIATRTIAAFVVALLVGTVLTHVTAFDPDTVVMLAAFAAGVVVGRGWPV